MEQLEILENYCKRFNEFNIFKVLKMQSGSENRHSNLIAWLLDPKENHGLNTLFLDKFFTKLEIKLNEDSEYCQILREENCEIGRPDILIKDKNGKNVVCVIEVKFGAKETNNQCEKYFGEYGTNCQYIFLDIDDKCYNELAVKEEYCHNDFNFSQIYKLATFKNNILPIIKELVSNFNKTHNNLIGVLNQYVSLLEEKYYILNDDEIKLCFDIIKIDENLQKYSKPSPPDSNNISHNILHNFIWHTVPNRYNDVLVKIINDLNLNILHKWIENGSSLSLRCTKNKNNYDYHDNEHLYFDHRQNKIILNFQKNINQAEKQNIEIIKESEYFENMLLNDKDFYEKLKEKINQEINS